MPQIIVYVVEIAKNIEQFLITPI